MSGMSVIVFTGTLLPAELEDFANLQPLLFEGILVK
jgi:hypothetical protein